MARPDRYFDWHHVREYASGVHVAADGRLRLRVILLAFSLLVLLVFGRMVQLEWSHGAAYREKAAQPHQRRTVLSAPRGRILARDGSVLAFDEPCMALAVHYRYLQQPLDPRWLRSVARSQLPRSARRDPRRVAHQQDKVRVDLAELHRQLARMCQLSPNEWAERTARIERRVEAIAQSVNERHDRAAAEAKPSREHSSNTSDAPSWLADGRFEGWLDRFSRSVPAVATTRITVAEELAFHVVVDEVPLQVVAEIEAHPEQFKGVRLVPKRRRRYPGATLAAHVLGHLSAADEDERRALESGGFAVIEDNPQVGRLGIEYQYDHLLRGTPGIQIEMTDSRGTVLETHGKTEAVPGRDLVLTVDPTLQRTCESLLDAALRRRRHASSVNDPAGGGAIVVLDVHTGEVLALASAPTFDPNVFVDSSRDAARLLIDDNAPLVDRAVQMALPPGSVFKPIAAVALLSEGVIDARQPFYCQGFLERPDRQRCQIYMHRGVGHGDTTLSDALVRSCNVYFFHHATALPAGALENWAHRFGLGEKTNIDLPYESSGQVPKVVDPVEGELTEHQRVAEARALVIGQSTLTATPIQMARAMAAIAGDGRLVTPRLVRSFGTTHIEQDTEREPTTTPTPSQRIEGVDESTLTTIRSALRQVVADPEGTAHQTVSFDAVSIAGKTGTAQSGPHREDHAWFVGYAPHERPKVAFAIALEHAGSGSIAAGPVARRVVEQLDRLGYFKQPRTRQRTAAGNKRAESLQK